MYQSDKELECILLGSPSSASTASDRHPGSPKDPEEITAEDGDLVMKAVTKTVSLQDPFTLSLMECPVRGRDCLHVQAFDRRAFLDYNDLMERDRWCKLTKKWKCPFCGKHIRSGNDLVEAADIQEMLDAVKVEHSDATFAVLHPDGHLSLPSRSQEEKESEPAAVDTSSDEEPSQPVSRTISTETSGAEKPRRQEDELQGTKIISKKPALKKATSKKERKAAQKAALAVAKAAWVGRQNEKQGSILSYCQKQPMS